jgi:hypothetical protein
VSVPIKLIQGSGAGNSVFPLLSANKNPELVFKAFDYSSHAVKLVQVLFFLDKHIQEFHTGI